MVVIRGRKMDEGCDHQDECNGLKEGESERDQQELVDQVGHQGCQGDDEDHGSGHSGGSGKLVRDTQERTCAQELGQHDVIDEYRRNDYEEIFHGLVLFCDFVEKYHQVAQGDKGTGSHDEDKDAVAGNEFPAEGRPASEDLAHKAEDREAHRETKTDS